MIERRRDRFLIDTLRARPMLKLTLMGQNEAKPEA